MDYSHKCRFYDHRSPASKWNMSEIFNFYILVTMNSSAYVPFLYVCSTFSMFLKLNDWQLFFYFSLFSPKLLPCGKTMKGSLLWGKRGGLSFTSVSVMFTVVVPDKPPIWPPISLAWITTWYCSLFSLFMFGKAVLMIPWRKHENLCYPCENLN